MQENSILQMDVFDDQTKCLTEIDLIIQSARELKKMEIKQVEQEKRLSMLEVKLEQNSGNIGYYTIKAWCKLYNIRLPLKVSREKGYEASRISRKNGIHIGKIADESFGTVNSYREDVLLELFGKDGMKRGS
jgi:hypothetical protein